jgi:TRAP-type C4-dicarboxylate transport system permease small subunit
MIARLRRAADLAIYALAVVVTLCLLGIVVAEAFLRNLGGVSWARGWGGSLPWAQELSQYLMVWLGFIGWMIATRRRSHIRVGIFIDRLGPGIRRAIEVLIQLAVGVFAVMLIWQGHKLITRNIDIGSTSLPLPNAVLYVMLPVLGIVMLLQAAAEIAEAVTGRRASAEAREGGAS